MKSQLSGHRVYFPPVQEIYAERSLQELGRAREEYRRVQLDLCSPGLLRGQVLLPNFVYELRGHAGAG